MIQHNFLRLLLAFLLVFVLFIPTPAIALEKTVLPDPASFKQSVIPRFYWMEDAARTLTINDVAGEKGDGRFTLSDRDSLSLGLSGSALWVRFTVVNSSSKPADWILENDHPLWDFVEFYAKDENGAWTMKRAGDHVPFSEREIAYRKSTFHATIPPGAERTFYTRLYGEIVQSVKIKIALWPEDAFHNGNTTEYILLGLFFGSMAVMFFYNLFLFFYVGDRSYLWYVLYVLGISLCWFAYTGLSFQYLWPNSAYMADNASILFALTGFFFAALFGRSFLETRRYTPRLDALFLLSAAMSLAGIAFLALGFFKLALGMSYQAQITSSLLYITAGAIRIYQGYRPARFYLLSWSMVGVGHIIMFLKDTGFLPYNALTLWAPQMGTWLDVVLLSFALADRINFIMAEREKVAAKLLETTVSRDLLSDEVAERKRTEIELLKAKEKAESATKLKDQFVALVSHDLRSPLYSLSLGIESAISKLGDNTDPAARNTLVKCHNNVNGLLGMVGKLLDINRLQTGKLKPNKVFINAKELVSQVYFRLASLAQDKKITLANDVPMGRKVFADNVLFQQVIQNLVANAIKYCRDGDSVTVSIATGSPNTILVKDTGVGVDPKILPDIFKAEVTTTTLGTKGEKGSGLGLPLCHNIMKAHGGDLRVESTPGAGSAFYVELPVAKAIALVVDDQRVVREEVARYLAQMGVEVVEAENGQEGYEKAISVPPQLIITDITMPIMDGLSLLDKLKSQQATTYIPVIVMTSSEDSVELRRDVFSRGAADFISKPIVPADFVPRIQRFVTS